MLWGGHGNPLQYFCLENPHGQRSLEGYSPWGCKESDMTEWLSTAHTMCYIPVTYLFYHWKFVHSDPLTRFFYPPSPRDNIILDVLKFHVSLTMGLLSFVFLLRANPFQSESLFLLELGKFCLFYFKNSFICLNFLFVVFPRFIFQISYFCHIFFTWFCFHFPEAFLNFIFQLFIFHWPWFI